MEHIDHASHTVTGARDRRGPAVPTADDEIVIAGGSTTRTFPIPGLAEKAIGTKTIEEAVSVRKGARAHRGRPPHPDSEAGEAQGADLHRGGRRLRRLGVDRELEDMARTAVERNDRLRVSDLRFVLVEAMGRIMPRSPGPRREGHRRDARPRHRGSSSTPPSPRWTGTS
ncbi:hypothetical protein QJS66_08505 [Kocuria rhizophila]|nr:hypothetical protein QJS66_08505 [Kocuria rhizophila]